MACVSLPAFPLQVLFRRHPDWRGLPAAVVEEDKPLARLLWVNEEARTLRVLPGMRYAAGLSLARELRAGVVSPLEIGKEIDGLAERLRFYTPEVEPSRSDPGIFWLNPEGLDLLHPSLRRWADLVRLDISRSGYTSVVTVGFSRFGVYAAAKADDGAITIFTDPQEEWTHVRDIHIDRLGIDPEVRDALARLGIDRLGGFLDLPSAGVRRRFGEAAERLYLVARGTVPEDLVPEIPEEPLERRVLLDHPENDTARLLSIVEEELAPLLVQLRTKDQDLIELTLCLVPDRYRPRPGERNETTEVGGDPHDRLERLRPARPTRDIHQLLDLVRLRIESLELPAGVVELRLEVQGIGAHREQRQLFSERPLRDRRAVERALARVRAEFGDTTVVRAGLRDGHLPEARFAWDLLERLPQAAPRKVWMPPLVRRVLASAEQTPERALGRAPESERQDAFEGKSHLFSGGWWRRPIHRTYHFLPKKDGGWVWAYYDAERGRWYRQGEVG